MDDKNTVHEPEEYHKFIVDSTCIAIHQSDNSEQRKVYYHAKSPKNYEFKLQVACDFNHRIVHISKCYPGSVHDITILRESGLLEHTQEDVQSIAGEGYVITPKKKHRASKLASTDKDFNQFICSARAAIEGERLKNPIFIQNKIAVILMFSLASMGRAKIRVLIGRYWSRESF
jgi:hypothetical protein